MNRKAFQLGVLVCLMALVVAYPAIEYVDHWDAPGPASDSELQYIGVLTVVGAIALFTRMLTFFTLLLSSRVRSDSHLHALGDAPIFSFFSCLTASPPLPLRI